MKLFSTFIDRAPNKVFVSIVLGALAGVSYAFLIPLTLSSLVSESDLFKPINENNQTILTLEVSNYPFAAMFLLTCLFILVTRTLSQIILAQVAMQVTTGLRIHIYRRISMAPIITLENLGQEKLIAALTTDIPRIVMGARVFPDMLINTITLIGMLIYLLYLNPQVFIFVVQAIFIGIITYKIPISIGARYFNRSRGNIDHLHKAIHGLINGAKELKLNPQKREAYFENELLKYENLVLKDETIGHSIYRIAVNYGDLISFFVIGAVAFIFINYHSLSNVELIGVIMVLLYISGPIGILLNFAPQLSVSQVSLKKVNQLLERIPEEQIDDTGPSLSDWQTVTFKDIEYQYGVDNSGFKIGPLNFSIRRGEVTFIIGGNGSGKSTLSKLITQHYMPHAGQIYFDNHIVDSQTISAARQSIGAIYSDYYLFDRVLLDDKDNTLKARIDNYLVALKLDSKVSYESNKFSTLALSDGQKRRLALLVAYLEDKDMYLFDEWAADQDPVFKDIFYKDILSDLKKANKAVIVISHDDRYFSEADQLIIMDAGNIIETTQEDSHDQIIDTYVTKRKITIENN